jgi:hypothetical protein
MGVGTQAGPLSRDRKNEISCNAPLVLVDKAGLIVENKKLSILFTANISYVILPPCDHPPGVKRVDERPPDPHPDRRQFPARHRRRHHSPGRETRRRQGTDPTATVALGRLATGCPDGSLLKGTASRLTVGERSAASCAGN